MKSYFLGWISKFFYKNKKVSEIFKLKSKYSDDIELLQKALEKLAEVENRLYSEEIAETRTLVKTIRLKYALNDIAEDLRVALCDYQVSSLKKRSIEWPARKKVLELLRRFILQLKGLEMVDNLPKHR